MDTISRENNNYLPIAGVIVGVLALILSAVALAKISTTNKKVESHDEAVAKIEMIESEARNASNAAETAKSSIRQLSTETNAAFGQAATQIQELSGEIAKIKEASKAAPKAAAGSKTPAVAGPNEYVVKSGDTGVKIARANGCSLQDLMSVNPNVNWNRLSAGAKIKLPKK